MSITNAPIHDLLIRIKNAYLARRETVKDVIYSSFKKEVLDLLKRYNYILDYTIISQENNKKFLSIKLKEVVDPVNDIPVIKFVSKPSRRMYVGYELIKSVAGGRGIGIISTNKGLMATHEAKAKKLGGELIAEIY
ncbi:MAG: 30S ribosomal protein S8 [Candidatus Absconditabacteria bacterium]